MWKMQERFECLWETLLAIAFSQNKKAGITKDDNIINIPEEV